MGCDIHLYSEAKRNGKWEPCVPFVLSDWWYDTIQDEEDYEYDTPEYQAREKEFRSMSEEAILEKYGDDPRVQWDYPLNRSLGDRNYNFFAILADVRNGRGFAGVVTGDGFNTISDPRGLPEDVSEQIQRESDGWDCDGHSHSYVTLKELLDFDWEQNTGQRGVLDETEYSTMIRLKRLRPRSWSGSVVGPGVEYISNDEMEDLINGKFTRESAKHYFTEYGWGETYREAVGADYLEELCTELSQYGEPEDVRIVFWFDN